MARGGRAFVFERRSVSTQGLGRETNEASSPRPEDLRKSSFVRACAVGLALAIALAVLCGASTPVVAQETGRPVPKAECGPTNRKETVQGRMTPAERFAPGPAKSFNCNLELISQHKGDGAGWGMVTYDRCAYYDTRIPRGVPGPSHPGAVVVDMSDSRKPQVSAYLDKSSGLVVNESMAIAPARKLMVAQYWSNVQNARYRDPPTRRLRCVTAPVRFWSAGYGAAGISPSLWLVSCGRHDVLHQS